MRGAASWHYTHLSSRPTRSGTRAPRVRPPAIRLPFHRWTGTPVCVATVTAANEVRERTHVRGKARLKQKSARQVRESVGTTYLHTLGERLAAQHNCDQVALGASSFQQVPDFSVPVRRLRAGPRYRQEIPSGARITRGAARRKSSGVLLVNCATTCFSSTVHVHAPWCGRLATLAAEVKGHHRE